MPNGPTKLRQTIGCMTEVVIVRKRDRPGDNCINAIQSRNAQGFCHLPELPRWLLVGIHELIQIQNDPAQQFERFTLNVRW